MSTHIILRMVEIEKDFQFSTNGENFVFQKGEKLAQVQTPIGQPRNRIYVVKNNHVVGLPLSIVKPQFVKQPDGSFKENI